MNTSLLALLLLLLPRSDIYAVNSIAFNPAFGTFATAGSDGTYHFWDKDSKQRLKAQVRAARGGLRSERPCVCERA